MKSSSEVMWEPSIVPHVYMVYKAPWAGFPSMGGFVPPSQKKEGKIPPCHTHKIKKIVNILVSYLRGGHFCSNVWTYINKWPLKPFRLHLIGALKQAFVPLNPLVTLAKDILNLDLGFSSNKSPPLFFEFLVESLHHRVRWPIPTFFSFWRNPCRSIATIMAQYSL